MQVHLFIVALHFLVGDGISYINKLKSIALSVLLFEFFFFFLLSSINIRDNLSRLLTAIYLTLFRQKS